jgi:3-hydroxyisobutyrate dehydrogenase-like beta-hydroxyacid dehydrogenase
MRTIGFIGLGTMGFPMAENLLKKGYRVIAYNRTSSKSEELAQLGATAVSTVAEAVRDADVVITMLSDDSSVQSVYYGESGLVEHVRPGVTVIDTSTISPGLVVRIAKDLEARGAEFLDAPVTGSKPAAVGGTLLFMVGGKAEVLEQAMDIFQTMGSKIVHMGPSGSGSKTKLAHNAMVGIHVTALAEGLSIAAKSGLDVEKFLEIVRGGSGNSKQAELKGDKILDRDFTNQFSLKLMLKDLILGSGLADELKIPTPVLDTAKNMFLVGASKGLGDLDLSAVVQCYEEWTGLEVKRPHAERRRNIRVPMNVDLKISVYQWEQEGAFSGQQIDATLYDLSESGLQIRTKYPLAADMFVVIHFPSESHLPPIIGKIIRLSSDGDLFSYGCMLSGMTPYVRVQLEEYLRGKTLA